jgi:alkanesulfonate monooxygenase SsuD/methylene tetrahydromethanopterin reductase-like flavin-dependent oxidoreductase (luciferase family)
MLEVWGPIGSWPHLLAMSRTAERTGLDSIWVPDHLVMGGQPGDPPGTHDGWTVLTALAAVTERIAVGSLVLCAVFRNPALVAKMAATLDRIAPDRLILGVGAGSYEPEFDIFGFEGDHKVGRFEEWIEILVRLLDGDRVTFEGRYYTMRDAALAPPPVNRIPIMIGSTKPRMSGLAARWADAWSYPTWNGEPNERAAEAVQNIDEALASAGRDPTTLPRAASVLVRDPNQAVAGETIPSRWDTALTGTVDEMAEALGAYADSGFEHIIVKLQPATTRSVERLGEAAQLARSRVPAPASSTERRRTR